MPRVQVNFQRVTVTICIVECYCICCLFTVAYTSCGAIPVWALLLTHAVLDCFCYGAMFYT